MAVSFSVKTTGFQELSAKLTAMPDVLMEKHIRKSVASGAMIIRDAARNKAPIHIGDYPASREAAMSAKQTDRALARMDKMAAAGELSERDTSAMAGKLKRSMGLTGRQSGQLGRKSGTLWRSINIKKAKTTRDDISISVGPSKKAWYGKFFEYERGFMAGGKTHVPARPFLRPAFDQNVERVLATIKNSLQQGINEVGR